MAHYAHFKFKYPGQDKEESFDYEIPYETFVKGIRRYFEQHFSVNLDATDKDVWNMCVEISPKYGDEDQYVELFDTIEEEENEFFQGELEEDAFEQFKEDWEADHEDENMEESKKTNKTRDLPTEAEVYYSSLDPNILGWYDLDETLTMWLNETFGGRAVDFGYYWQDEDTIIIHDIKWKTNEELNGDEIQAGDFEINVEQQIDRDRKKDSIWYDDVVASFKYKDRYDVIIKAVGDVRIEVFVDGDWKILNNPTWEDLEEVGIKDDDDLQRLLEEDKLGWINNNWFEFEVFDNETGEYISDGWDTILNDLDEVFNSATWEDLFNEVGI